MKAKTSRIWEYLKTSYWLVPFMMIAGAAVLAIILIEVDSIVTINPHKNFYFIFAGQATAAGQLLSTIAATDITISSIVFSVTIVVLTLASNQFGSRLIRNFMADRITQFSFGAFISTFVFCLIVLANVRHEGQGGEFVPNLSVSASVALAVFTGLVLIFYIHHIAIKIQAEKIVSEVSELLEEQIDLELPDSENESKPPPDLPEAGAQLIRSAESGYIEVIDYETLFEIAFQNDLTIKLEHRAGQFIISDMVIAKVVSKSEISDDISNQMQKAVVLNYRRTPVQDIEFSIGQMVEVAIRALSPGINDAFTAIACVDRLGQAFARIARKPKQNCCMYDENEKLRIIKRDFSFERLLDAGFSQIREMSRTNVAVACRILESFEHIARNCKSEENKDAAKLHARLVYNMMKNQNLQEYDMSAIESRFKLVQSI